MTTHLVSAKPITKRESPGPNHAVHPCFGQQWWPLESFGDYLHKRLAEVGIHSSPFEPAAETLLLQSGQGLPRTLNALLQRAMEQAALANRRVVSTADVQLALDALPWLARPRPS